MGESLTDSESPPVASEHSLGEDSDDSLMALRPFENVNIFKNMHTIMKLLVFDPKMVLRTYAGSFGTLNAWQPNQN